MQFRALSGKVPTKMVDEQYSSFSLKGGAIHFETQIRTTGFVFIYSSSCFSTLLLGERSGSSLHFHLKLFQFFQYVMPD